MSVDQTQVALFLLKDREERYQNVRFRIIAAATGDTVDLKAVLDEGDELLLFAAALDLDLRNVSTKWAIGFAEGLSAGVYRSRLLLERAKQAPAVTS